MCHKPNFFLLKKKYRIGETLNLLTDADNSTNTMGWGVSFLKSIICVFLFGRPTISYFLRGCLKPHVLPISKSCVIAGQYYK